MAAQGHPPFTGDGAVCAKCGAVGARTEFRAMGGCIHGSPRERSQYTGTSRNERLHRECNRCGWEWDEAIAEGVEVRAKGESAMDAFEELVEAVRTRREATTPDYTGPGGDYILGRMDAYDYVLAVAAAIESRCK